MLQLQRASAGSGKTYTLAKKFIWFLITFRNNTTCRLRTSKEIAYELPRILAITFTNKATNEMKQRIVAKLADIALAASGNVTPEMLKNTAYLKEFSEELGVEPSQVGRACRDALFMLLNNYSDFKVSTIDSFFQSILRTFAYEANLNDSYQVEIDTDYLATAAVDATLDTINNTPQSGASAEIWLRCLMDDAAGAGSNWNVFQRSETRQSIYTRLRKTIHCLENESFKEIRADLDNYFDSAEEYDPLVNAYFKIKNRIEPPVIESLKEAQECCNRLSRMLKRNGINPKEGCRGYFYSHINKLPLIKINESATSKNLFKSLKDADTKPILKKGVSCPDADEINRTAAIMYAAYDRWIALRESRDWKYWTIYSTLLPYLGLLGEARKMMTEFLDANNMIQLGETNSILKRIIGDDDTPFIYERLGTTLDNFLIDEFQDTSKMQWDILKPLLSESDSRGEDNLIIGDAKQSIYRFRNADPSLITTVVPSTFTRHRAAGMSKAENTNWRSDRRIVEFNNFFFHSLIKQLLSTDKEKGTLDFDNLYNNVAQFPSHREERGYVEIRFFENKGGESGDGEEEESGNSMIEDVCPLISDLMQRGYRCRDIAVLVDTNQLGKEVISAIVAYNSALPRGERKIDFISEESLLVSSAEATGIIISVLRKMATGLSANPKEEETETIQTQNWEEIRTNFTFYSLRNSNLSVAEQISGFLNEAAPDDVINNMLAKMQSVALPALIEAITENFVPENLRKSQAVFIAALQDMVLDYCERSSADLASFLNWWDTKGKDKSISSPEGTDAIQIMTIHKAKGLEFKCVIMPYANTALTPSARKKEWRWVKTAQSFVDEGLPKYLPVETTPQLLGTEHEEEYLKYHDLFIMDNLNAIYVAFTRAVSELYIFTKAPKRVSTALGSYLKEICGNADELLDEIEMPDKSDFMLPKGISHWNETADILSFGERPEVESHVEIATDASDAAMQEGVLVIEEYGVDSSPAILQYVERDLEIPTPAEDGNDDDETTRPDAIDNDPRSEGNILHAIMGMVKVSSDLPRALTAIKMKGLAPRERFKEWGELLEKAIASPLAREWFESDWKVINERPILYPYSTDRRPDRIMISPDRKQAIIIDYKFGSNTGVKSYHKQVADYIRTFHEASGIRDIRGYIWYVRQNLVETV